MENNNIQNNIGNKILEKIREGKLKMKSKSHFIARAILFAVGAIVLLLFLIYIVSFIIFSLRISGAWFLPRFGFLGIRILLGSLPWLLIFLSAILIIILEIFAERLSFIYRRATIYSLIGIIGIVVVGAFIIGAGPLHPRLFHIAREGRLPVAGPFYEGFGAPPRFSNFHNGSVSSIINEGFTIVTPNGETLTIVASPAMKEGVKEGDNVLIIGERDGDTIKASLFRKVNEDPNFFPGPRRMMRFPLPR